MRPFSYMTKRFEIDPRLKQIADHYGFDAQAEKAIEEMAELIVAIKGLKKIGGIKENYLENFVEELADVKIMIDQLCYLNNKYAPEDYDVESEVEFKIERQLRRIAEEEQA